MRKLIEYQTEDYSETMIQAEQAHLNALYDSFVEKYGRINSRANSSRIFLPTTPTICCPPWRCGTVRGNSYGMGNGTGSPDKLAAKQPLTIL